MQTNVLKRPQVRLSLLRAGLKANRMPKRPTQIVTGFIVLGYENRCGPGEYTLAVPSWQRVPVWQRALSPAHITSAVLGGWGWTE